MIESVPSCGLYRKTVPRDKSGCSMHFFFIGRDQKVTAYVISNIMRVKSGKDNSVQNYSYLADGVRFFSKAQVLMMAACANHQNPFMNRCI